MTWDEIVAVSQLVAALGVILSLIFLAIQLQQNTKAVRATSIQNLVQILSATAQTAVDNEYLVPLMLKANSTTESLSAEERARLHFWFVMCIRRFEGVYFQKHWGLVDSAAIAGFERSNVSILARRRGRVFWEDAKGLFNAEFVAYMDKQLERHDARDLHPVFQTD
jgi:hypothetical protein